MNAEFCKEDFDYEELDIEEAEEAIDEWGRCSCSNGCFNCLDISIRDFM